MGLFGGDDKKKKIRARVVPRHAQLDDDDDDNPLQSLQIANQTRSIFWNNIKSGPAGQSWNKSPKQKQGQKKSSIAQARAKRRKRR